MKLFLSGLLTLAVVAVSLGQSALPEVTILSAQFDQSLESLHVEYEIDDADDTEFTVGVLLSNDEGKRFDFPVSSTSGDIGTGIINDGPKMVTIGCNGIDPAKAVVRLYASDNDTLDIQAVVDQVDMDRLRQRLTDIQGIRHRGGDPAHLDTVRTMIQTELSASGPMPQVYSFAFGSYTGQNIMGYQQGIGAPNSEYYVGGHYDSVFDTPGADDNGTAVAAMLEAAHVLGNLPFNKTIRYASWDLEEAGLVGSMDYINNILQNKDDIEGYLNMEMIGYYKDEPNAQTLPFGFNFIFPVAYQEIEANEFRGDFLTNVGNEANSMQLMQEFEFVANEYVPELSVISIASPGTGSMVPDLLRSDHASFWSMSIPAVMLTDGANFRNPNYHTPQDVVDSLDMEFFANNTKAVVAFLAAKAEYNHAGYVDMDSISIMSGVNQINPSKKLNIYPSPAYDYIQFDFGNEDIKRIERLSIFTIDGKLVREVAVDSMSSDNARIPIRDMADGQYMLRATIDGEVWVGQFLVVR